MIVYLLVSGMYEDRMIRGVYSTPELAMAAWAPKSCECGERECKHTLTWLEAERPSDVIAGREVDRHWEFDADWGSYATVEGYEIDA